MEDLVLASNEVMASHFSLTENTFRFCGLYQCFIGPESSNSVQDVFGESLFWRIKLNFKNLRKKASLEEMKLCLPADTIIFYKKDKHGLIAASPSKKFAFKIFLDPPHIKLLDAEIETLKKIKGTPFESSASGYISDGLTSQGARWVLSDFRSNKDSLRNSFDTDHLLMSLSYSEIMPRMAEFYRINSPQMISIEEWLTRSFARAKKHPEHEILMRTLNKIKGCQTEQMLLESAVHYDLHAGNILRSKDHYSIIDWEGNLRSLVLIDGLDFLRRYLQKKQKKMKTFASELKQGRLTEESESLLESFVSWQKSEFKVEPISDLSTLIFIYAVERALLLWEVREVNRFRDKKGIEFNVLS